MTGTAAAIADTLFVASSLQLLDESRCEAGNFRNLGTGPRTVASIVASIRHAPL